MGCRMLAVLDSEARPPLLESVPAWFEEWEQALSRFRPESELSLLNMSAGRPVRLGPILWEVFQASREAERLSGGLVTPLVLGALIRAGYDRSFDNLQDDPYSLLPEPSEATTTMEQILVDAPNRTVSLQGSARLDFGGVAKGWAAQRAMERLNEVGPALVDAGGDIAVSGPQANGEPWPIGVADPWRPETHVEIVHVAAGGVATSGKDYRRWMRGGRLQHHLIDPRSGLPAETDVLTATVIAPTVLQAEAIAKAAVICGSQQGMDLLEREGDLAGLLLLETGQRLDSRKLGRYL
jgi:FAD:protein FMN transferase